MSNIEELSDWERTLRYMQKKQIQDSLGARSGLFSNPKAIGGDSPVGPFDAHDVATEAAMSKILANRKPTQPMYRGNGQDYGAYASMMRDHDALDSANSLEAERNHAMGWLKGSEQHRAKLEKSIEDYDREIAKLKDEIAMSEAGDPMYDLAVMRMVMNNDMSLMSDIRGRISKKIDQEFQMKQKKADQEFQHEENELNRENTLETARMNKEEQKKSQQKELDNAIELATDTYMTLKRKLNNLAEDDPRRAEIEDQVGRAEILMKQAYRKANKLNEYDEVFGRQFEGDETIGERKTMLYKSLGVADDREFQDLYNSGDAAQKALYERKAKYVGIPLTKLGVSGTKAKDDQKKEQNEKDAKTKKDFKDKNAKKTFAINILDGKAEDTQDWVNFQKAASNAGWNVELQTNGTILWK